MSRLPMQWIDNNEKNRIPDRLFTPLYGVNLTGGLFERVFRRNAEFLKKISVDAALYCSAAAPARPPPASPTAAISRTTSRARRRGSC